MKLSNSIDFIKHDINYDFVYNNIVPEQFRIIANFISRYERKRRKTLESILK